MKPKQPKSVTDKRILPPKSGLRVKAYLFEADNGLLQVAEPMIRQRRSALAEDIIHLLRKESKIKKTDAAPIAEKILELFEWYGYRMFDK